jgi:hypothetical protein
MAREWVIEGRGDGQRLLHDAGDARARLREPERVVRCRDAVHDARIELPDRDASSRSRIGSACSSNRAPASVTPTGRRVSNGTPTSASNTAMCWETADWV